MMETFSLHFLARYLLGGLPFSDSPARTVAEEPS